MILSHWCAGRECIGHSANIKCSAACPTPNDAHNTHLLLLQSVRRSISSSSTLITACQAHLLYPSQHWTSYLHRSSKLILWHVPDESHHQAITHTSIQRQHVVQFVAVSKQLRGLNQRPLQRPYLLCHVKRHNRTGFHRRIKRFVQEVIHETKCATGHQKYNCKFCLSINTPIRPAHICSCTAILAKTFTESFSSSDKRQTARPFTPQGLQLKQVSCEKGSFRPMTQYTVSEVTCMLIKNIWHRKATAACFIQLPSRQFIQLPSRQFVCTSFLPMTLPHACVLI